MSTTKPTQPNDAQDCPECGEPYDNMDKLVDHLSDDHDAFDWVVDGRPMQGGKQ